MDFTQTPLSDCKVRSIIKFLIAKNKTGAVIHQRLYARNFKIEHPTGKVTLMTFWDCWGLIHAEFVTDASKMRTIITKDTYVGTILHMQNVTEEWRCEPLS